MNRDTPVNERIAALLARVEGVRRASDIGKPTTFDDRGERHAAAVAAAEAVSKRDKPLLVLIRKNLRGSFPEIFSLRGLPEEPSHHENRS